MTDNNPITPPPELLEQLRNSAGASVGPIMTDDELEEELKYELSPALTLEQLLLMPGSSWVKYSPWEREGYCDEQGRCWFQQYGKWILAHPGSVVNTVSCLPAHITPRPLIPIPTTTAMTQQHPITPPPELVEQLKKSSGTWLAAITNAYQAGADQQLAEDAKWLDQYALDAPHLKITPVGESLKETMRPQPPSLKEQALAAIMNAAICDHWPPLHLSFQDEEIIRRALEALPND